MRYNDLAYRRMRLAEALHPGESETISLGDGCRTTIRGTESERLRLRADLLDMRSRGLLNYNRPRAWNSGTAELR
jgi:hypothetical protein